MPTCLSQRIEELAHVFEGRRELTLKEIMGVVGPKSQAFVTLVLAIPFVILIPLPGLSILFGAVIFINGFRIARKKPLWIPNKLRERKISGSRFAKNLLRVLPFVRWVEKFVKPRGTIYQHSSILQVVNGCFLAVGGFFLLLPLPPGTNFLPGLATLFLSLGILEEDVLMLWIGYLLMLVTFVIYILIPFFLIR